MNWCTGINSMAVTFRFLRCSMITGWPNPAYVPRSSSGMPGCVWVMPLTCAS